MLFQCFCFCRHSV